MAQRSIERACGVLRADTSSSNGKQGTAAPIGRQLQYLTPFTVRCGRAVCCLSRRAVARGVALHIYVRTVVSATYGAYVRKRTQPALS